MLRDDVEERLRDRHLDDGYLFPAYEDYCFGNVPGTVESLFDGRSDRRLPGDVFEDVDTDAEHVVLVLLDGFGLDCWKRDRERHDLLADVTEAGRVTPLTSIYPSETAAAIPTLHTGRTALEHGRLGWDVYLPELDLVVESLPFRTPDGRHPSEVLGRDVDRSVLDPGESVSERLAAGGVAVEHVVPTEIVRDGDSDGESDGVGVVGYENVAEIALAVRRTLERAREPTYCYAYLPHVDAVSHQTGTESPDYQAQLAMILGCLRRELVEKLDGEIAAETLLLVTADHGHIDTDPDEAVDLMAYDVVSDNLQRDGSGEPIPPVGSARNAHLHLKPGTTERVAAGLREELDARVFTRSEALDVGLFGPGDPHPAFEERCGDVILTGRTQAMYHEGGLKGYVGLHGGMRPAEMLVPFGAVRLGNL